MSRILLSDRFNHCTTRVLNKQRDVFLTFGAVIFLYALTQAVSTILTSQSQNVTAC